MAAWYTRIAFGNHFRSTGESGDSSIFAAAHGVGSDGFAVEQEAGSAAGVCPEGPDMGGLQLGENFFAGMAEAVAPAAGDDCPVGMYGGKELRTGGCQAAVMANFEEGALQAGLAEDALLFGSLGVPRQQD